MVEPKNRTIVYIFDLHGTSNCLLTSTRLRIRRDFDLPVHFDETSTSTIFRLRLRVRRNFDFLFDCDETSTSTRPRDDETRCVERESGGKEKKTRKKRKGWGEEEEEKKKEEERNGKTVTKKKKTPKYKEEGETTEKDSEIRVRAGKRGKKGRRRQGKARQRQAWKHITEKTQSAEEPHGPSYSGPSYHPTH